MFLNLDDRLTFRSERKAQRRRIVLTMHSDGSGSVVLYYGTNLRGDLSLAREDWEALRDAIGRGLDVVAEEQAQAKA
jgi:hypothetical protein